MNIGNEPRKKSAGSAEEVAACYFDEDAIRETPRPLYRYERAGQRWYFAKPEPGSEVVPVSLGPSVTTVIRGATPMPPFLLKWIAEHGQRRAEQIRDERAAYGTLMHILFAELVIAKKFDLDSLTERVAEYLEQKKLALDAATWPDELAHDLIGLADFLRDHEVKPIGIEVGLLDDELGYAGCLDLVALGTFEVSNGKGKKKTEWRGLFYDDWKSGRKQFYEESAIQCHAYLTLWNRAFPEHLIERAYLHGAKDWDETSRERYRMSDVTEHPLCALFPNLLEQFRQRNPSHANRQTISGLLRVNGDHDACITTESLESYLSRVHGAEPHKHAA
jgi:hypothetical protein